MSSLNPSDTSIAKSVLTEPIPAPAEKTTVGKETDNNEMEENLIDYKDDIVNHSRETKRKILRDALAENGFALRNVLLSEPVINHYASPLAMEEMSVEDIMSQPSPVMNMVMTIVIITSDQSSPKSFITIILVMNYRPNHS